MFAFALWDARRQQLLIARDRVGKKPLLYAFRDGILSFASEMQALLRDTELPREVDHVALDRYLAFGYVPAPLTALRGVSKLPPAHTLLLRDGRIELRRYWQLDYSQKLDASVEEICERIREALQGGDAAPHDRRRAAGRVPVGRHRLVGGRGRDGRGLVGAGADVLDRLRQPALRRAAARASDRRSASAPSTRSSWSAPTPSRCSRRSCATTASRSPTRRRSPASTSREMTRRHVTVALNGDGGDESFGGYTRYVANARGRDGWTGSRPRCGAAIAAAGARVPERRRRREPAEQVPPARRHAGARRAARATPATCPGSTPRIATALYTPEFAASIDGAGPAEELIAAAWRGASGESVVDRMLEVDVRTYLVDDLIAKIDIATMAHALEARSPFLDHQLMELAASIPADLKVRGGEKKWILRDALRGWLPDDLLDRPKQGFSVPLSDWLRGDLEPWAREVLLDPGTLDRGYFDPAPSRGCSTAMRPGPTATPSASGR